MIAEDLEDNKRYIQEWANARILDTTVSILRLGYDTFEKCMHLFNRRFYVERIILAGSADDPQLPVSSSSCLGPIPVMASVYDSTSTSQASSYLMPYCAEALCIGFLSDMTTEKVLCSLQKQSECYRNGAPPVAEVRVRRESVIEWAVLFAFGRAQIELTLTEFFPNCDFREALFLQGILVFMHLLSQEQNSKESEKREVVDLPLQYTSIIMQLPKSHIQHLIKIISSVVEESGNMDGTIAGLNEHTELGVLGVFVNNFFQSIEHPDTNFSCESASWVLKRISVWLETVEKVVVPWTILWEARRSPCIGSWVGWASFLLNELSPSSNCNVSDIPLRAEQKLLSIYVMLSTRIISWRNTDIPNCFCEEVKQSVELFYGEESSNLVMWLMHVMGLLMRYK